MRRNDEKNFTRHVDEKTGRDTWVYTGPRYAPDEGAVRLFPWLAALPVARLALFFLMGFFDGSGTRVMVVALPFVATGLPLALCAIGGFRLSFRGGSLTEPEYRAAVTRPRAMDTLVLILSACLFPAETAHLCINARPISPEAPFLLLNACLLALTVVSLRLRRRIVWTARP